MPHPFSAEGSDIHVKERTKKIARAKGAGWYLGTLQFPDTAGAYELRNFVASWIKPAMAQATEIILHGEEEVGTETHH